MCLIRTTFEITNWQPGGNGTILLFHLDVQNDIEVFDKSYQKIQMRHQVLSSHPLF